MTSVPISWLFCFLHLGMTLSQVPSQGCGITYHRKVTEKIVADVYMYNSIYYILQIKNISESDQLSVLMLCAPSNHRRPFSYHMKMADFEYFRVLSVYLWRKIGINSEKCIEYGK